MHLKYYKLFVVVTKVWTFIRFSVLPCNIQLFQSLLKVHFSYNNLTYFLCTLSFDLKPVSSAPGLDCTLYRNYLYFVLSNEESTFSTPINIAQQLKWQQESFYAGFTIQIYFYICQISNTIFTSLLTFPCFCLQLMLMKTSEYLEGLLPV